MIVIKIGDKKYECPYEDELKCSEEKINDNLKDQPGLFAFYAVQQEMAEYEYRENKLALEILEAQLDGNIRKADAKEISGELLRIDKLTEKKEITDAKKAFEKREKLTEKKIASLILLDEDYQTARLAVDEARKTVGILKAIVASFIHRKDMLVTLAANMRIQMDPEIYIKKEEYKDKG